MTETPPSRFVSFSGAFDDLAAMMRESWAANRQQPLLYTSGFLANAFEFPGSSLDLAPTICAGGNLRAFVAGFPRHVAIAGRPVRLLLNTFLTVAREQRRNGYGPAVFGELIERAKRAGFEGTINFCVEGDDMNRMMLGLARLLGLSTQRIYTVNYLTRFVRPTSSGSTPEATQGEIDLFLDLTAAVPQDLPLRRCWTREEALWQCRGRSGAVTASLVDDGGRGMMTGYLMDVEGAPPASVVLIEDVLWGDLEAVQRSKLLAQFLRVAGSRGARTASCPMLGYAELDTLKAAGFGLSKRALHAYLTLWNGQLPAPADALYIDVL